MFLLVLRGDFFRWPSEAASYTEVWSHCLNSGIRNHQYYGGDVSMDYTCSDTSGEYFNTAM